MPLHCKLSQGARVNGATLMNHSCSLGGAALSSVNPRLSDGSGMKNYDINLQGGYVCGRAVEHRWNDAQHTTH
jgi:hypothetical protein